MEYKLCVLVCRGLHGTAPEYLTSRQQLPMHVRRHDSATSTFGGNITTLIVAVITRCSTLVPCRRCTYLQRSSALNVIYTVTSYF